MHAMFIVAPSHCPLFCAMPCFTSSSVSLFISFPIIHFQKWDASFTKFFFSVVRLLFFILHVHPFHHSFRFLFFSFIASALPLWLRTTKNPDVGTGPLARLLTHKLIPLTPLLAPHYLLPSSAPLHSFVRLLILKCREVLGYDRGRCRFPSIFKMKNF